MNRAWNALIVVLLALLVGLSSTVLAAGDPERAAEGWALYEQGALLIDVRSDEEFQAGHIEGALHIPHERTEALASAIGEDKDRTVVLYCRSGGRVGIAIEALEAMGYTGLFNATGYEALQAAAADG